MQKKILVVRIILIIIIISISSLIFSFSNQNAEQSSGISAKVAEKIIQLKKKYKNISEEEKKDLIEKYQKPVRKFAHFSIYTALGLSIIILMCTYKMENRKRIIITLISGVLYAISDEIHQLFIEGRSGQITDVLIDSSGIVLAIFIVIKIKLAKYITSKIQ